MPAWTHSYLLTACASFAICAVLTRVMIHLAPALKLVDTPKPGKHHRSPTPVGGGLAIYLSLLPVLLMPEARTGTTTLLLAGGGLLTLVGLADDRWGVSAQVKLILLVGLTGSLWYAGIGATTTRIGVVDLLITVLWMTGLSSAFNAIDNMDGLATGAAAIAAGGFLIIALQTEQWLLGGLSAALLGSTLGFLMFNIHPARIFMGDSGSFFLGFLLASLGVVGEWHSNELIAAIIPILLLGLPIFDLTFTVARRHLNGVTRTLSEALAHCDTDHLSHRLTHLGLSTRGAVALLWLISASFTVSAVTLQNGRVTEGLLHLLQALLIVAAFIPVLALADHQGPPRPQPPQAARPALGWLALVLAAVATSGLLLWLD